MEGDLDGVRLQVEDARDLPGAEVGAEAKCDELAVAIVELRNGVAELEALQRGLLVALTGLFRHFGRRRRATERVVGNAAPRDADQPGGGLDRKSVV